MGRQKQRRMTPLEFEAIVPLLPHMSAERCAAARLALVDGRTQQSIAAGYGWVRQAVASAEAVVWRVFERYREAKRIEARAGADLPAGWARITIEGPQALIRKFEMEAAGAAADAGRLAGSARGDAPCGRGAVEVPE
ncbi:MAG: hypothetical protein H7Z39_14325 [Burkholderiaceae bacterium]|nr:hypothetical protein [Burkholderiaceae bacterium]